MYFMNICIYIIYRKLGNLQLQRTYDLKKIPLHPFEISCLANFIKDVSLVTKLNNYIYYTSIY